MIGGPVPRHQLVESVDRMACDHAFEDVAQPGRGFDPVELGGFDQRAEHRPAMTATIAPREQMVLAAERDRPDGALDRIGVELDSTIVEEAREGLPPAKRVPDGIGERTAGRDQAELCLKPCLQHRH